MGDAKQPEINQELLREIHRVAKIGTWEAKSDERLIWSNETIEMFGVERSQFHGSIDQFYELVHPEDVHKVKSVSDFANSSVEDFNSSYRIVRPDGKTVHIRQTALVVRDNAGNPKGFSGLVQDVTDQVNTEAELRKAQKMETIGRLSGGIAHDFNNLLAVILGNLELLKDFSEEKTSTELIEDAIGATRRGRGLVKSLLTFSGQADLKPQRMNLNTLLSRNSLWASFVVPKNIQVEVYRQENLLETILDPSAAEAAVLHLLLNARDAMPNGGKLIVKTENVWLSKEDLARIDSSCDAGQYVLLSVSDDGSGVPKDKLDRLFDPFFSIKPIGQATGLGLSMVHGFAKQSKGTIQICSKPELGTTFSLYFKALHSLTSDTASKKEDVFSNSMSAFKVLLAEDDEALGTMLKLMLAAEGYNVHHAKTGDEAFAIFEGSKDFNIVVTDLVMPGKLQGVDLAREVKLVSPNTPCILLSGYGQQTISEVDKLSHCDITIEKPASRADLISALRRLLS